MPPRFYVSPYKNQVAQVAKREAYLSEIPTSKSSSDSSNGIKAGSEYALVKHTNNGVLTILPHERAGKFGQRVATLNVGGSGKSITDFDVSPFDDIVACGYEDGVLSVASLPATPPPDDFTTLSPTFTTLRHSTSKPVECLAFHPTSSNLLASSSSETVCIWDVQAGDAPAFSINNGSKGIWSSAWSQDGRTLVTAGMDAFIKIWDPRSDTTKPVVSINSTFQPNKCSRIALLKDDGGLVKNKTVDTSTGVIMPVVDEERNVVYLGGRGDMTLRWVEIGGPVVFTEGASAVPSIINGIAFAPRNKRTIDVMKAEINRLLLSTADAVIPVTMQVPKRQYIDFHFDIFPDIKARRAAQGSTAWLQGQDAAPLLQSQDPTKTGQQHFSSTLPNPTPVPSGSGVSAQVSAPVQSTPPPASVSSPPPPTISSTTTSASTTSVASKSPFALSHSSSPSAAQIPEQKAASTNLQTLKQTSSSITPAPASSAPSTGSAPQGGSEPYNPTWSRKFLAGKTPLKVDYDDLKGLSTIASPDASLFKTNTKFMAFPLSGPGGKVGVHAINKTGRLPTILPAVTSGTGVSDFEWDWFDENLLWVSGDDGKIRSFRIPQDGLDPEAGDLGETENVLEGGMDKVTEIRSHPTVKGLLMSLSHDRGTSQITVWKTADGSIGKRVPVNEGRGVFCAEWSPDGTRIAVVTKDRVLRIFDPRNPDKMITGKTHDSPRVVRVAWEMILYKVEGEEAKVTDRLMLDVSPAILFPYTDWDTKIVFAFSRGERTLYCFEAQPDTKPHLFKLPSFDHGTLQSGWSFLPKLEVDVKKVEILKAFRLTPTSVQAVSFTVPRAKGEFFQNDIFVPTADTRMSTVSPDEWLAGHNKTQPLVNMQPEGMRPVSEAPESTMVVNTRAKIAAGPVVTESQKQEAFMDRIFKMAKDDDDGEEIRDGKVVPKGSSAVDDDDDW
ncbi:DUF1900-domain-containing protein [Atractiella rhizophila]|nr:DUF1900-domain-containing protein [Atractiella rhizophila]